MSITTPAVSPPLTPSHPHRYHHRRHTYHPHMIANALGLFSPSITLTLFALVAAARGQTLDTETAFTTMAILSIVTHPANMVMTFVPRGVAAFAGFERIQNYLLKPSLHDHREVLYQKLDPTTDTDLLLAEPVEASPAIVIRDLTVGERQPPLLQGVNIQVPLGKLVVISGPVGCGKSTLLRAVLGEVSAVKGSVGLSTRRVAYCAQRPWLPSGSIRSVILGAAGDGRDVQWYRDVVEACCLTHDIDALPDGDGTQIGAGGLNLSWGQRQRVVSGRWDRG